MNFHEFGDRNNPSVILIHGGGNAWWNYLRQGQLLSEKYHVILPTMDGHGEEYGTPYVSTEKTADKLLEYIDSNCGGRVFALCGVSLGGQIVIELLSRRADIAEKAIIDGAVCYPNRRMAKFCTAIIKMSHGMLFSERACRIQLALMPRVLPPKMHYPMEMQAHYLRDMPLLPKETMVSIYRTYMHYSLKESLKECKAQVMYWYGEKEMKYVKRSAELFRSFVPSCRLYEAKGYNHGYLALYLPEEWYENACAFFDEST